MIVSRAGKTIRFPAQFMLVAAMNPCPCGHFGSNLRSCKCSPGWIARYLAKVSGPLVDRIDIHIDVPAVAFSKLPSKARQIDSESLRATVMAARDVQYRRFGNGKVLTNAHMTHQQLERFCRIDPAGEMMLKEAMMELGLSARAHDRICKVARTIADLEGSDDIRSEHVAEAISYRKLDRKLWRSCEMRPFLRVCRGHRLVLEPGTLGLRAGPENRVGRGGKAAVSGLDPSPGAT